MKTIGKWLGLCKWCDRCYKMRWIWAKHEHGIRQVDYPDFSELEKFLMRENGL